LGTWADNGWRTRAKAEVKKKDICEALLAEVQMCHGPGVAVELRKSPREWNEFSDAAAKQAALLADRDEWLVVRRTAV